MTCGRPKNRGSITGRSLSLLQHTHTASGPTQPLFVVVNSYISIYLQQTHLPKPSPRQERGKLEIRATAAVSYYRKPSCLI